MCGITGGSAYRTVVAGSPIIDRHKGEGIILIADAAVHVTSQQIHLHRFPARTGYRRAKLHSWHKTRLTLVQVGQRSGTALRRPSCVCDSDERVVRSCHDDKGAIFKLLAEMLVCADRRAVALAPILDGKHFDCAGHAGACASAIAVAAAPVGTRNGNLFGGPELIASIVVERRRIAVQLSLALGAGQYDDIARLEGVHCRRIAGITGQRSRAVLVGREPVFATPIAPDLHASWLPRIGINLAKRWVGDVGDIAILPMVVIEPCAVCADCNG